MRYDIKITDNLLLEPILHTFGVKQESTYVNLTDSEIEISMGRWFHEHIPLAEISALAPSDWPWWGGLGVKLAPHGVGVVGSLDGLVNVEHRAPRKVRAVGEVEVEQLWISLADQGAFLRALAEATKLPISDHVKF